jgi:hypothetical protein
MTTIILVCLSAFNDLAKKVYLLRDISGYVIGTEVCYPTIWENERNVYMGCASQSDILIMTKIFWQHDWSRYILAVVSGQACMVSSIPPSGQCWVRTIRRLHSIRSDHTMISIEETFSKVSKYMSLARMVTTQLSMFYKTMVLVGWVQVVEQMYILLISTLYM